MGTFDLFSKRQRRNRGEVPDVYVYDDLPNKLRVQIVHIIEDAFGQDGYGSRHALNAYAFVKNTLCREYGLFKLTAHPKSDADSIFNFFLEEESIEQALDVVELCFQLINSLIRQSGQYQFSTNRRIEPDDAIAELNVRFKENGVGYQFESNEIIRVDSEFLHVEAVKPTLAVLRGSVRIPCSFGRAFHNYSATHSTRIRPLIPRPFGHPQAGASQVNFNLPSTLFGRRSRDGEIDNAKRKRSAPAQAGL